MKIVYVADIADDIDDLIAIDYLFNANLLDCVVLDGKNIDIPRMYHLANMGINLKDEIPKDTKTVFCGGALTKVVDYLEDNVLDLLVIQGGFAGCNVVDPIDVLPKFKNKTRVRTYNFNLDNSSVNTVLNSGNLKDCLMVSKNVCHSKINVEGELHNDEFLPKYCLRPNKCLHDLLMVKEGVAYLNNSKMLCEYKAVDLSMSLDTLLNPVWGSELNPDSNIKISTKYK